MDPDRRREHSGLSCPRCHRCVVPRLVRVAHVPRQPKCIASTVRLRELFRRHRLDPRVLEDELVIAEIEVA